MNLDANALLASLLVSSIGLVLFMYGRRMTRLPQIATGLILMIFPYFVGSVHWMFLVATLVLLSFWLALRMGL